MEMKKPTSASFCYRVVERSTYFVERHVSNGVVLSLQQEEHMVDINNSVPFPALHDFDHFLSLSEVGSFLRGTVRRQIGHADEEHPKWQENIGAFLKWRPQVARHFQCQVNISKEVCLHHALKECLLYGDIVISVLRSSHQFVLFLGPVGEIMVWFSVRLADQVFDALKERCMVLIRQTVPVIIQ